MVQGEASPARAWTAAEPLVSRYNEKGRVVGELEVPLVAPGFGLDERVLPRGGARGTSPVIFITNRRLL